MNTPTPGPAELALFSPLADALARTVVSLDGDIALLMDPHGVITRVACSENERPVLDVHRWVGRHWAETVSGETRPKVQHMLDDIARTGSARRRQVNHPLAQAGQPDVPVLYAAVRLGQDGPVLAVGRDMRSQAQLQQRFADAQDELERGYWRHRQAHAAYERLFQAANDAVALVEPAGRHIVVANAPVMRLFAQPPPAADGQPLEALFDPDSRTAVARLVAAAAAGTAGEIRARAAADRGVLAVSAARMAGGNVLVRARGADPAAGAERDAAFAALIDPAGDAVVVADDAGRVLAANPAFVALVRAAHESQVLDRPLADWLPHEGPLHRQLGLAAAEGIAPPLPAELRAIGGTGVAVDFGAIRLDEVEPTSIGVVLHRREPKAMPVAPPEALRQSFDRLVRQLGRRPLDLLLRETRAQAETVLLRAALDRCGGDPQLAAELLGIGRGDYNRRAQRAGLPRIED